jgi:hypothetical protein
LEFLDAVAKQRKAEEQRWEEEQQRELDAFQVFISLEACAAPSVH